MNKLSILVLIASAATLMSGCGGSSSFNRTDTVQYADKYTGTWAGPETKDGGAFALTIDSIGNLSGSLTRVDTSQGTIVGTVDSSGHFKGGVAFSAADGNWSIDGELSLTTGKVLTGTFSYYVQGVTYTGTFNTTGA